MISIFSRACIAICLATASLACPLAIAAQETKTASATADDPDARPPIAEADLKIVQRARALLACWNAMAEEPAASLAAALARSGAVEALRDRLERHPPAGYDPAALVRRLAHFASEDARVPRAARAFAEADAATPERRSAAPGLSH